jgi:hypothetical protein
MATLLILPTQQGRGSPGGRGRGCSSAPAGRSTARQLLRLDVRREKTTIVDADFLGDELVQQGVHPQQRRPVLLWFDGQVVSFIGIVLQIEKLDVVVFEDLIQCLRRIEREQRGARLARRLSRARQAAPRSRVPAALLLRPAGLRPSARSDRRRSNCASKAKSSKCGPRNHDRNKD